MSASAPEYAVETRALGKTYGANGRAAPAPALVDVDLVIPRGSFFGLLGANGAGKSTLINILAGLVVRSVGEARVWGFDIDRHMRAARRAIGVVPQELSIDPFFSPREALELQAGLYGVPRSRRRTDDILAAVGLAAQAEAYARTLSGGMRRRLLVAKAMVHTPPVLVLDEPTAGVDVALRRQLWAMLREMNAAGTTIVLTTHYIEEAEALCERVAILDRGRLVACDSTRALLRRSDAKRMTLTLAQRLADVPAALARFEPRLEDGRLVIRYAPSRTTGGDILGSVAAAGLTVVEVATREAGLEEVFLGLTGAEADP